MCTAVKKPIYKILAAKNTTELETRPVPEFFAGLISTTSSVVFLAARISYIRLSCKFKTLFLPLFINYLPSDRGNKIYLDEKGVAR